MQIGIIGTGSVGTALQTLLTGAGHQVILGSRNPSGGQSTYEKACNGSEVIILAIPFFAAEDVLPTLAEQIADRIVIDATNPLNDDWSPRLLGQENSAAEEIARLLPDAKLVKAFNTIFADIMSESGFDRHGQKATLFIAGDDEVAVATVAGLASDMGLLPVRTGALTTARYLEAMAHLNIAIAVGQSGGTNAAFVYHRA